MPAVNAKMKPRGRPFPPGHRFGFRPGESGNPGGKPKVLVNAMRRWLAAEDAETGKTHAELVAEAIGQRAADGDEQAAREMRAATETVA